MAITIAWDNDDKSFLLFTFDARWTWNEYFEALDRSAALLGEVDRPVGIIMDMERSNLLPDAATSQGRKLLTYPRHKNYGPTVAVGTNRFIQTLGNTVRKIYRIPGAYEFMFASNVAEGREMLRKHMGLEDKNSQTKAT